MLELILFFFITVIFIFCFTSHPRTKTPCPDSYPVIGNIIGLLRNRNRFHDWVTDMLNSTPSSTIQVNYFLNLSHIVCTANPINIEHLLVTNFSNYVKGSRFLDYLYELLGYGIFNVDGQLWTVQRKIASHEFKTKSLKFFISDVVNSKMKESLMPDLFNACDENLVFDIQDVLGKFTFSTICKIAFGVDFVSSWSNLSFSQAFDDAVQICFSRFLNPLPLTWKVKRFLNLGSEKRLKEAINTINQFASEIINSKLQEQETNENQDLLSRFMFSSSNIEFKDQEHKTKFLRDIVISFLLAGKDTSSTVLTWFFWLLAGNPHCTELIYQELIKVVSLSQPEAASKPSGVRVFAYDELKKLHYLHAALSETLRLFPPVSINSRLAINDDILPDGTHIRKGWCGDYSAYAVGRMEKVWGKDCREFKPERWLDDEGKFQPVDQFRFPVFHCGPRTCLGKDLAYIQMKAIATAVMYEFEIVGVDGGVNAEKMMNPPYQLSIILKMKNGFRVTVKRRQRGVSK